jgi:hypoxanthine phosphoribosyltransferase
LTLSQVIKRLRARRPRSIAVCALLNKRKARSPDVALRYVGFEIPNRFVVGYGLDYMNRYRNLKYVGVVNGR